MRKTEFSLDENLIRDYDNMALTLYVDKEKYYEADYKILSGYTGKGLLPIYKSEVNGHTKLIYDLKGKKSLVELFPYMDMETFIVAIDMAKLAIEEVSQNGFLRKDNLLIGPEYIFIEERMITNPGEVEEVSLVYIPYMDRDKKPGGAGIGQEVEELVGELKADMEKRLGVKKEKDGDDDKESKRRFIKTSKGLGNTSKIYLIPKNEGTAETIEITKDLVVIGRIGSRADITIDDTSISREHCFISYKDGEWYIEDMGSKNGTFVNDNKLSEDEKTKIVEGDEVRLSKMVFVVSREPVLN